MKTGLSETLSLDSQSERKLQRMGALVRTHFPEARLRVERVRHSDPGAEDQWAIIIETDRSPEYAAEAMRELDREWHGTVRPLVGKRIFLDVEF